MQRTFHVARNPVFESAVRHTIFLRSQSIPSSIDGDINIYISLSITCLNDATLLHASRMLFLVVISIAVRHSLSSTFGPPAHPNVRL